MAAAAAGNSGGGSLWWPSRCQSRRRSSVVHCSTSLVGLFIVSLLCLGWLVAENLSLSEVSEASSESSSASVTLPKPEQDTSFMRQDGEHCTEENATNTLSLPSAPPVTRLDLNDKLLFLHMGKAGGGAINARLQTDWNLIYSYCHPSPNQCQNNSPPRPRRIQIADWMQQHPTGVVLINLRDPIDRFVSAFYWRRQIICRRATADQQQDSRKPHKNGYLVANYPDKYCRTVNSEEMEILFGPRYNQSANGLAMALCSDNETVARQAHADMRSIAHASVGIRDWLGKHRENVSAAYPFLFPIVQEFGYDMLEQVDDAVGYIRNVTRFKSDRFFVNRQERVVAKKCAKGDGVTSPNIRHSSASSKKPLSVRGSACLSHFYDKEYGVLVLIKETVCPTRTCREAIASILDRRPF